MLNFLREHQHFKDFISVVWATCITETIIYPITTARIRMQMRRVSNQANSLTAGKTMRKIAKNEGFKNLFSGLLVNYLRQVVFHSFQISMETPINMRLDGEEYSIYRSAARVAVGLVGLVLIQPFVVVKVRYQAGIYPRKLSMITLFRTIYEKEGPRGLYRGLTLNGFRSAIAFTSDKFSRDPLDEFIKDRKTGEREKYIVITGATTFITVLLTNPIDVVRNRYINAKCVSPHTIIPHFCLLY
ncbi:mitochondrial uncoupling protein 2-like isoform X2 [Hermetia illucens]|uniref:mitochondrial uncoupling protein 2-like isoform X2 n=1 Tax=Hermetia illucens TaxID=343691 RepID=UPI0018CC5C08|nr:mitochondrial uncoupling protein 2-like isoform X2 [Hermetia illucens]